MVTETPMPQDSYQTLRRLPFRKAASHFLPGRLFGSVPFVHPTIGAPQNGASVAPMNFQNPICHVQSKLCLSSSPSPKGVEISWHTKWKFLLEDPWVHPNATLHFLGVTFLIWLGFILDLPCFAICFEQHLILSSRHPEHHTLEPPRGMGSGPQDPGLWANRVHPSCCEVIIPVPFQRNLGFALRIDLIAADPLGVGCRQTWQGSLWSHQFWRGDTHIIILGFSKMRNFKIIQQLRNQMTCWRFFFYVKTTGFVIPQFQKPPLVHMCLSVGYLLTYHGLYLRSVRGCWSHF